MKALLCLAYLVIVGATAAPGPVGRDRLSVLDEFCDLYYPDQSYPKLTTPQWIGEDGVDAALVLAIDDMRDPARYEAYLRPILNRLKEIDGRAPVSIMTCKVEPGDPQLQSWLKEGLSLEVHTIDHPCPILDKNDFAAAKSTYDRCVDLISMIPGNTPVAFRTPCMDGINSASPRLFAEIMRRTAPSGHFLTISSSIGMLLTPSDPENPKDLVTGKDGRSRFDKYVPAGWVNYIQDYPYPWVIGNAFWETGFCIPDDYQGSKPNGDKSPETLEDMKASIDAVVAKKGLWVMTFHPYNWIGSNQVVQLIDHTVAKHGKRVKFLNLREVQERIDQNLLSGQPLRRSDGGDNGVRLLDLNRDGYLDVVMGNAALHRTRVWNQKTGRFDDSDFPTDMKGARFGTLQNNGFPSVLSSTENAAGLWSFDGSRWIQVPNATLSLTLNGDKVLSSRNGRDNGVRFRDLDGDGISELIVSNPKQNAVFAWNASLKSWRSLPFALPNEVSIVTADGRDNGVRFVDLNKDGAVDLLFSNEKEYGLWLYVPADFLGFKQGFSRQIFRGKRGDKPEIPMIVRGNEFPNNGAWFAEDAMLIQNEDTGKLPDLVQRVPLNDLLNGLQAQSKSPQESLASMVTMPGFKVELVANEPQVESPVYVDWSADGAMWVVEMRDYPKGINGKAGGVVKRLLDEDGDGVYEKSTIFLDHLNYPNGLFPWRKGILISASPDIIYAEDTDGDGRADKTEVLFTGFVEGNQQHRANGYDWGLDGWLYGANGDSGGEILSIKTGRKTSISGRDFRFRPDTGEFEAISGNAQYGRRRDDWGNWFGGANYTWGWNYFLEEQYLSRNPALAVRATYKQYASGPDANRVFPISRVQQRFNDIGMAGHVTSACSFTPYRDNLLGDSFEHSIFISEPVHNLVHREILETDGVTFSSHRASSEENREFLASRDPWFRPTTVKTGPDGALYICDMYRLVIEHPEWIPDDVQKRMNLRAGEGLGRIYRVRPTDKILPKIPNLAAANNETLIDTLNSQNGWQRDTAQRLLLERRASDSIAGVERIATEGQHPKARLQALATIETLEGTTPKLLLDLLSDSHPAVRAHAVRLSERFASRPGLAADALLAAVLKKSADPDLRVRYQLAFSAGALFSRTASDTTTSWSDRAAEALAELAMRDANIDAMITAILSSSAVQPEAMLKNVLAKGVEDERLISGLLKTAVRLGQGASLTNVLVRLVSDQPAEIPGWKLQAISSLLNTSPELAAAFLAAPTWAAISEHARRLALDANTASAPRSAAISLLARTSAGQSQDIPLIIHLAASTDRGPLQRAALLRLEQLDSPAVAQGILATWSSALPSARSSLLALLLTRAEWTEQLLSALESDKLSSAEIGATIRQELLASRAPEIRARAAKILAPVERSRDGVVRDYLSRTRDLKGEPEHGHAVFESHCALCHKAGSVGTGAGPNLAMLYDRGPEQIITAILDPNRAIEDRYRNYVAELKDGEETSGLLVSETGNSITIAGINGIERTLMRSDLKSLTTQNRSLMPEGFEQFLQPQDVADLIAFIQNSASAPKHFPGNHPEAIRPASGEVITLTAANAEIYGDTLIFEAGHQNLGYWKTDSDRAVWTVETAAPGHYEVWLTWACPDDRTNNEFIFQMGDQRCVGAVEGTGSWDDFKQKRIGEITLGPGSHRAALHSNRRIKGFLFDLQEIRLVPKDSRRAQR